MANLNDLKGSDSFRKLNPTLFGGMAQLQSPKPESVIVHGREGKDQGKENSKKRCRYRVTLVSFRRRLLDGDNLEGGFKAVRDAVASKLGVDDNEQFVDWEYAQVKTRGIQGTIIKIENK